MRISFLNFAVVSEIDHNIERLLLVNDCVIIPDFGGFVAHHIDARRDERDDSLLPPYRSVGFNSKLTINDSLLVQAYVETYNLSYPEALRRIEAEVAAIRQELSEKGSYSFSGIGTITLNAEGHIEFTPFEAGIVTPVFYGLGSFEMETLAQLHAQETEDNDEAEQPAAVATESEDEARPHARLETLWRSLAAACIVIIAFLLLPTPLSNEPGQIESGMDIQLLDKLFPTQPEKASKPFNAQPPKPVAKPGSVAKHVNNVKLEAKMPSEETAQPVRPYYSIVLASKITKRNAEAYVSDLQARGYADVKMLGNTRHRRVIYGEYADKASAQRALNALNDNKEFAEAWVMKVK